MNIPFLRFLKREKAAIASAPTTSSPSATTFEKPASERLGKTVMPNASRYVGADAAASFPLTPETGAAAMGSGNLPIGFASPGAAAMPAIAPRKISLGANGAISATPRFSSPDETAQAIAERKIALQLADLLPQIAPELLQAQPIDPERRVLFHASELERGMTSGHPTATLRSIYQQAPELFTRAITEADPTQVALPFGKVLEQFASFQVRPDQMRTNDVPQVETPFLQVAMEDEKRFRSSTAPIPRPEPPVPSMRPAASATAAAPVAEPAPIMAPPKLPTSPPPAAAAPSPTTAPIAERKPIAPIRLPIPAPAKNGIGTAATDAPAEPRTAVRLPTPPTPAKITSNGTGEPASERVPASSGPPVPTLPSPFAPAPLARIPFKMTPPSNDLREGVHSQDWSVGPARPEKLPVPDHEGSIQLRLREVLSAVPPFQLSGPPLDELPETARIEFPIALIKPQLSSGRVEVSPAQFQAALPEEFRAQFDLEDQVTPIPLPLPEILKNLPNESLQIRGDQEETEVGTFFETPFSQKAAEDAERLKVRSGPIAKATVTDPAPRSAGDVEADPPEAPPPTVAPKISLQPAAETASPPLATAALDPKAVVAQASSLPGVQACAIVFSDGLSLAGNIPPDYDVDALCAITPAIMKRMDAQMTAAKLGALTGITVFCERAGVTLFAHGNICLAALNAPGEEIDCEARARLGQFAEELARTYAPPAS
jgi:predicted regulator of Ras-like GTPase activity (Roadblock/LC7/MglB family)